MSFKKLFISISVLCSGCGSPPPASLIILQTAQCQIAVVGESVDGVRLDGSSIALRAPAVYHLQGVVHIKEAAIGDTMSVSVMRTGPNKRRQVSANSHAEIKSLSTEKLSFSLEIRIPEIHGDKFELVPTVYHPSTNSKIELTGRVIAIENPQPLK